MLFLFFLSLAHILPPLENFEVAFIYEKVFAHFLVLFVSVIQ